MAAQPGSVACSALDRQGVAELLRGRRRSARIADHLVERAVLLPEVTVVAAIHRREVVDERYEASRCS